MSPPEGGAPVVRAQDLVKRYPSGVIAVDGVSFEAARGELIAIVGESGSGKTTTLKMINRLLEPTGGFVEMNGEPALSLDPIALRRRIGWVMQGDGLFPHFTVAENIAVTPQLLGWERERIAARVDALLDLVLLDPAEYRERFPKTLSGGQRQRVAVARALAAEPPLLLMDEPFGALDPITRDEVRGDFQALREKLGFTAVMVTHDMAEALLMADRIAVMAEGRLLQIGAPEDLLAHPADDYVARLMKTPLAEARGEPPDVPGGGAQRCLRPSPSRPRVCPTPWAGTCA